MRALSWFAICWATLSFPPFRRYSVTPVAGRLWYPIRVGILAALAQRQIMYYMFTGYIIVSGTVQCDRSCSGKEDFWGCVETRTGEIRTI